MAPCIRGARGGVAVRVCVRGGGGVRKVSGRACLPVSVSQRNVAYARCSSSTQFVMAWPRWGWALDGVRCRAAAAAVCNQEEGAPPTAEEQQDETADQSFSFVRRYMFPAGTTPSSTKQPAGVRAVPVELGSGVLTLAWA
eukprot:COSAG03_NODE_515_length_7268_cov_2.448598_3_plen_140_part_00